MAEGSSGGIKSRRLAGEPALQEDLHFPPLDKFYPPDKLPTIASIIGRMRSLSGRGKCNMTGHKAALEVAKEVESKYFHDTIYCMGIRWITNKVTEMWTKFQEGKRLAKAGRHTLAKAKAYVELIRTKDQLFDASSDNIERHKVLEEEWGVKMGEREKMYLEDQRGPRLMSCDHGVNPIYYRAFMKQQRLRERDLEYTTRREEEFRGRNMEEISEFLRSQGEFSSRSPESVVTPAKPVASTTDTPRRTLEEGGESEVSRKKVKLFHGEEEEESDSDSLPQHYRHLRGE